MIFDPLPVPPASHALRAPVRAPDGAKRSGGGGGMGKAVQGLLAARCAALWPFFRAGLPCGLGAALPSACLALLASGRCRRFLLRHG